MKKILLFVSVFTMLLVSCSCQTRSQREMRYDSENAYVVETQTDLHGNIISKSVYNKITQQTYIYSYTYKFNDATDSWECADSNVVVISSAGSVIYPEGNNG